MEIFTSAPGPIKHKNILAFVIDVGWHMYGAGVGVEVEVGKTKLPYLVCGQIVDGAFDLGLVLALDGIRLKVAVNDHLLGIEVLHLL